MDRPELFALKGAPYGPALLAGLILFALSGTLYLLGTSRSRPARVAAEVAFAMGSALLAGLWVYRWFHVDHLPMQSMFEIFLLMGAAVYPLFAFCRRAFGARLPVGACAIAFVLTFPAAFINGAGFAAAPRNLPPALQHWLFGPHVAVYILSYVIMALAAFHAAAAAILDFVSPAANASPPAVSVQTSHPQASAGGSDMFDRVTHNLVRMGFPLLTLGLVLGSVWGKIAWGDWWNWDPKEMWSLAGWLTFVGYFHFRWMHPGRLRWASALWVVAGFAIIVLTLLSSILPKLAAAGMHSYAS